MSLFKGEAIHFVSLNLRVYMPEKQVLEGEAYQTRKGQVLRPTLQDLASLCLLHGC